MNWTLESLTGAIHQWGRERGIHQNGNLVSQSQKLIEEAQETLAAAPRYVAANSALDHLTNKIFGDDPNFDDREVVDEYEAAYKEFADGIGDTFVVLVQLCAIAGVTLEDCVEAAYEEIRDRKGHLNEDGVFVKESE